MTETARWRTRALLFTGLVLASGCNRRAPEPEPRDEPRASTPAPEPAAPRPPSPPAAAPAAAGRLGWPDPPGWERATAMSAMRLATYKVPRAGGDTEDGELTVFHFGPGQGGSIESNLVRWEKQFTDVLRPPARSRREVNGLAVHLLEIESGSYSPSMMPGGGGQNRPGYGLLAAIVEAPAGLYFFKLSARTKTVQAARPNFERLLEGLRVDR